MQQAAALLKKSGHTATVETTAKSLDNLERVQGYAAQRFGRRPAIQWRPGAIVALLDKDSGQSMWSYVTSGVTGLGSYVADPLPDGYSVHNSLPGLHGRIQPGGIFLCLVKVSGLAPGSDRRSAGFPLRESVRPRPRRHPSTEKPTYRSFSPNAACPWLMPNIRRRRESLVLLLQAEAAENRATNPRRWINCHQKPGNRPADYAESSKLRSTSYSAARAVTAAAEPSAQSAQAQPEPIPEPVASDQPAVVETPEPSQNFPVRLITRTPIPYPREAKDAQIQGLVIVELLIDEMGQVMTADVIQGHKTLAKAVVDAVKSWRFEPKMENGRTVVSTYTLPISFKFKAATDSTR